MSRPKNSIWALTDPKISPLGPQKIENDPKIKSKSKVTIEVNIENKSCSTTWVDPKTFFEPYPGPKNSPLGSQKLKNDPKTKSKLKFRIEQNLENKNFLTRYKPKKILNPTPNPKMAQ